LSRAAEEGVIFLVKVDIYRARKTVALQEEMNEGESEAMMRAERRLIGQSLLFRVVGFDAVI